MAYMVVALSIGALVTIVRLAIKSNHVSESNLVATQLAAELLAEVQLRKWDEGTPSARPGYPAYTVTYSTGFGVDSGESSSSKAGFDDVDDFDGWSESPPQDPVGNALAELSNFTRTVSVDFVTSSLVVVTSTSDYKLVTVCATRTGVAQACVDWLAANR